MKVNFTKHAVASLPVPKSRPARYLDEKVRGLGVLVQTSGHKSFFWFRKVRDYPRRETIGACSDVSIEQARDAAEKLNNKLGSWKANHYEGENPFERRDRVTFQKLLDEYISKQLREHARRPEVAERDLRSLVLRHMKEWSSLPLERIRREDVTEMHRRVGEKHHRAANVALERVKTMFNFAVRERMFSGVNPAIGIQKYHEASRTRFLQPVEFPALGAALDRSPNSDLKDAVGLALTTGVRKANLLAARWEDIDLDRNIWTITDPKNRVPYTIPLTTEAVAILKDRVRSRVSDNPWVFPSHGASGHTVDLKKRWKQALKDAGLEKADIRWHDLRRTQGSYQAAQGTSLPIIGRSLGHSSVSATAIYSRVNLDAVRESMATANATMAQLMKPKPKLLAAKGRKKARRG